LFVARESPNRKIAQGNKKGEEKVSEREGDAFQWDKTCSKLDRPLDGTDLCARRKCIFQRKRFTTGIARQSKDRAKKLVGNEKESFEAKSEYKKSFMAQLKW